MKLEIEPYKEVNILLNALNDHLKLQTKAFIDAVDVSGNTFQPEDFDLPAIEMLIQKIEALGEV